MDIVDDTLRRLRSTGLVSEEASKAVELEIRARWGCREPYVRKYCGAPSRRAATVDLASKRPAAAALPCGEGAGSTTGAELATALASLLPAWRQAGKPAAAGQED